MGDFSLELCGGTHVKNTSEIEIFVILGESSLSSGVRRIEATTSSNALNYLMERSRVLGKVERELSSNSDNVLEKIEALQTTIKKKNKEIKEVQSRMAKANQQDLFSKKEELKNGLSLYKVELKDIPAKEFRGISDRFVSENSEDIVFLYNIESDKLSYLLRTNKKNKNINCSEVIKENQSLINGRGGGRPDMAQGSGEAQEISKFIEGIQNTLGSL